MSQNQIKIITTLVLRIREVEIIGVYCSEDVPHISPIRYYFCGVLFHLSVTSLCQPFSLFPTISLLLSIVWPGLFDSLVGIRTWQAQFNVGHPPFLIKPKLGGGGIDEGQEGHQCFPFSFLQVNPRNPSFGCNFFHLHK